MPAKKKGKKGKKDEAPPPEPSEFDDMTIDALRQQIAELRPRLDRAQMDRNQVQLDRVGAKTVGVDFTVSPCPGLVSPPTPHPSSPQSIFALHGSWSVAVVLSSNMAAQWADIPP